MVSVLDLDNIAVPVEPEIAPYLERSAILMCISLNDVNSSDWTAKHSKVLSDLIEAASPVAYIRPFLPRAQASPV